MDQILARGDKVIATVRKLKDVPDSEPFASHEDVYILELDVTDSTENIRLKIGQAVHVWGRIDVLVNNAGYCLKIILEDGGYVLDKLIFGMDDECYVQGGRASEPISSQCIRCYERHVCRSSIHEGPQVRDCSYRRQ